MSKLIIKNKFATTPNELLYNPEISLRAKGLYGYIQAKPDGWNFSAERISHESKEGLHAVRMALVELEKFGYLERIKSKGDKGFWETNYVLHSSPINPTCDNPTLENPTCENPTLENYANNIKKDLRKKEEEINNNILITQVEPEGFDSLHFVIAKMFHSLFLKLRGENNTLKKVKTESYVDTIRLLLDVDKVSVTQLAALKLYLEDSKKEGSKLNPFWADTIFSVEGFRKKSKSGVYRWDLICLELKKWQSIEGNYQRATKLAETINQKAKEYDRIQEDI